MRSPARARSPVNGSSPSEGFALIARNRLCHAQRVRPDVVCREERIDRTQSNRPDAADRRTPSMAGARYERLPTTSLVITETPLVGT
jgi:hypothetical protein